MKPLKEGPFPELLNIFYEASPPLLYVYRKRFPQLRIHGKAAEMSPVLLGIHCKKKFNFHNLPRNRKKSIHRVQNISFSLFKIAYIHMFNVCKVCWKFKSSWNIWRQVKQIWNMGLLKCLQASVRGRGVWFQRLNINDRVNFRHTQIFLRPPQVVEKKEVVEVSSVWSQKRTFALRKGDFLISCFCFSW